MPLGRKLTKICKTYQICVNLHLLIINRYALHCYKNDVMTYNYG